MKWGVRKQEAAAQRQADADHLEASKAKDPKWFAKVNDVAVAHKLSERFVSESNAELDKLINKYGNSTEPFTKERRKQMRKEMDEIRPRTMQRLVQETYGKTKDGEYEARAEIIGGRYAINVYRNRSDKPLSSEELIANQARKAKNQQRLSNAITALGVAAGAAIQFGIPALMHGDFTADRKQEAEDAVHYGVKGMKWGVRKDRSAAAAPDAPASAGPAKPKDSGSSSTSTAKPKEGETDTERYNRLAAQAKEGKARELDDKDLKWFNARTEALAKIEKLNEKDPNWIKKAAAEAGKGVVQNSIRSVSDAVAKKYITDPLVTAINKPAPPKPFAERVNAEVRTKYEKEVYDNAVKAGLEARRKKAKKTKNSTT